MANTSGDQQLAAALGETPRRRRAAALAAQKNWLMLNKEPEEDTTEDDIIIITPKDSITKSVPRLPGIQTHESIRHLLRRTPIQSPVVIDFHRNKRKTTETDNDYIPDEDLLRGQMKAKKSFPTPLMTVSVNNINSNKALNITQKLNRLKAQEVVSIETQKSSRVIVRSAVSQTPKPKPIEKLHPNEPQDLLIVAEDVEEIVGTYEVNDCPKDRQTDGSNVDLDLDLFMTCESDEDNDDIEVIEVIDKNAVKTPINPKTYNNYKTKALNGKFDSVIGCLEMECENFDDHFTDGNGFDCEDDILSSNQFKQSVVEHQKYNKYSKSVISAKNVKFLPETEVTEPLGLITTTISETTKVIITPIPRPPVVTVVTSRPSVTTRSVGRHSRVNVVRMSQSIRAPIPSVNMHSNLMNMLRQPPVPRPAITAIPIQNQTLNGVPIALVPVSTSTQLLLSHSTANQFTPTSVSPLRVILSSGASNQPTYVMIPRSTVNSMTAPNISWVTNTNPINAVLNPSIGFINQSQTQFRASTPTSGPNRFRSATPTSGQTRIRSTTSIQFRANTPNPTQLRLPTNFRAPAPVTQSQVINTTVRSTSPDIEIVSDFNNRNTIIAKNDPIFECLTTLKGAQTAAKRINMKTVLTIKPLPFTWPSNIDDLIASLIKLDNALMKEKFKETPIQWMVNSYLIRPPKCRNCSKGFCTQVIKSLASKADHWMCNNSRCGTAVAITRPKVFEDSKFDIPVAKLLFIIYYWSIQVDVEDLIKTGQIELSAEKIFNVWQRLQKVCSNALKLKDSKIGSRNRLVEIASVQVGRFHVLAAMETPTNKVKATVVPISSVIQQNGKQSIFQPFVNWIEKGTTLKTCESKFLVLRGYGFKVIVVPKNEFLSNNKTLTLSSIGGYLIHHLQRFFKDFDLSTLSLEIVSNILDELLWRERFGDNPYSAFYNIIKHIAEQCGLRVPDNISITLPTSATVVKSMSPPVSASRPVGRPSTRPGSRPPVAANNVLTEMNSVFVDEYYYSSLKLKNDLSKASSEDETPKDSIQCHLCQMFYNNILLVKHLLEHLEKERGGRVRKGDNNETECKHCLRFFTNRTLHMHEELSNLKMVPYSCRICAIPYYARQPFIQHMKTNHFSGEMPYYCDICSYRSSFQKNLLDHFEDSHSDIGQTMCPFCIRVFDITKLKNLSQFMYRHLQSHYAVASVYDCDKCVLTFTSKPDLKDHCFKAHNPSMALDEKFEINPYVVAEEDKVLCIRAREQELFTPFLPNFSDNALGFSENITLNGVPNDDTDVSFEVSCEPNIEDLLSIEPECYLSLTDTNTTAENFILAVDCDYSNEQLIQMMTKTLQFYTKAETSEEDMDMEVEVEGVEPIVEGVKPIEPVVEGVNPSPQNDEKVEESVRTNVEERVDPIVVNDKIGVCLECKAFLSINHFISRKCCEKCNFMTHCKTAYNQHTTGAHSSTPELFQQISVLRPFPKPTSYMTVCKDCGFCSPDGNQIALHIIESKHRNTLCKAIEQ